MDPSDFCHCYQLVRDVETCTGRIAAAEVMGHNSGLLPGAKDNGTAIIFLFALLSLSQATEGLARGRL